MTSLPEDIEDTIRQALFNLFDLEPVQLMLLCHVRHGGTPNTFGREFSAFLKSSIKYGKRRYKARWHRTCAEIGAIINRATAWAIWNAMVRKTPLLAIFQTWGEGHGGRKSKPRRQSRYVQTVMPFAE